MANPTPKRRIARRPGAPVLEVHPLRSFLSLAAQAERSDAKLGSRFIHQSVRTAAEKHFRAALIDARAEAKRAVKQIDAGCYNELADPP